MFNFTKVHRFRNRLSRLVINIYAYQTLADCRRHQRAPMTLICHLFAFLAINGKPPTYMFELFEQYTLRHGLRQCNAVFLKQPHSRAHILIQVTLYRRLRIGRDGHLDQSEAYDMS